MNKYYIEKNELNDIEFDENDVAQCVTRYEYVVHDAVTRRPLVRFDYDWQAINYCKEKDDEGRY